MRPSTILTGGEVSEPASLQGVARVVGRQGPAKASRRARDYKVLQGLSLSYTGLIASFTRASSDASVRPFAMLVAVNIRTRRRFFGYWNAAFDVR